MTLNELLFGAGKSSQSSLSVTVTLRNLFQEAAVLAGALAFLHDGLELQGEGIVGCCHMDLKPDNIFIFTEPNCPVGIWKMADFGISAIMNTIATKRKRLAGPYVASEICEQSEIIGRTSDIWPYGCIFVELIASRMTGDSHVETLQHKRSMEADGVTAAVNDYFYRKPEGLNPSIRDWLDRSEKFIVTNERNAMAICKPLLEMMLNVEPARPKARMVRHELRKATKLLEIDVNYNTGTATSNAPSTLKKQITPERNTAVIEKGFLPFREFIRSAGHMPPASRDLLNKIKSWIQEDDNGKNLLWEIPYGDDSLQAKPSIIKGMNQAATNSKVFMAYHKCGAGTGSDLTTRKMICLNNLVISLVFQLYSELEKDEDYENPRTQTKIDSMSHEPTTESTLNGIKVLGNLWVDVPGSWICVIDGFQNAESRDTTLNVQMVEYFLEVVCQGSRKFSTSSARCKTLFTTHGRSLFLVNTPNVSKIEVIDRAAIGDDRVYLFFLACF